MLVHVVLLLSYQHWVLMDKLLGHPLAYVSLYLPTFRIFPNFHDPPASTFATFEPLSSFQDHVFFTGTLLSAPSTCFSQSK